MTPLPEADQLPEWPRITVVIANFNRCDDLRRALQSVRQQDYPEVSTIVVDNSSTDGSCEMLTDEFPDVELIALDENLGMAGYSVGFDRADSELIFQMDNDSLIPTQDVLTEVVGRFVTGPDTLAAVACRVEEFRAESDQIDDLRARDDRRGPLGTGGFHSGGVGFRRAALQEAGAYHRSVFLYGSELFLEMKLLARGFKIHYFPDILMLHKSSNVARSAQGVYFELRNRYWFMRRFANPWQRLRYLPSLLFHDLVYALYKNRIQAFFRALWDGFGTMPSDLRPPMRSTEPGFQARVAEFGSWFSIATLVRRIAQRGSLRPATSSKLR